MALSDCFVPADINLNSPNRVLLSDFGPEPAVPVGVAVPTIVPGLTEAEAEELHAELVKVWPSGSPYVECHLAEGTGPDLVCPSCVQSWPSARSAPVSGF